jgi:uncharacterized protein
MQLPTKRPFSSSEEKPNSSSATIASPLLEQRVTIIDSMRGIALLGILMMNIPFFGMAYQYAFNLNLRNEYSGVNYYTWWTVNGIFEGTMRGLFSLLFGAGTVLLLNRLEKKDTGLPAADFYYRRLIWLLIFGLINAFVFLWPGDILYAYAICGLFLYPFRILKPKYLLMFGLAILIIASLRETLKLYDAKSTRLKGENALALEKKKVTLSEDQLKEKEDWVKYQEKHKTESLLKEAEKETKEMHKGYFSIMVHLKNINVKLQSTELYSSNFWDILAFFFIGMALFKWRVLTGERSPGFYWVMLIGGYGIGIPLNLWTLDAFVDTRFDYTRMAERIYINFYQSRRLLVVLGHIGLIMLFFKYHLADWLLKLLSRVGQMAFTNYLMQSIICVIIFYGFGLNWYGALQRYQLYYIVGGVWLFQIIFSNIWLMYFRFGPFEWLWRSLTYWRSQPMRIKRETKAAVAFA